MQRRIHTVLMALLFAALLAGCSGGKSSDPSRSGRLESGDAQLSDGSYVDFYTCKASITGGVSIDMSSPTLQCLIAVVQGNSDGTGTLLASSGAAGPAVTASWTAVKGQTYAVGVNSLHQDTGDYTLTFHDLDSIATRAAPTGGGKAEIDLLSSLKKR